jgi:hypothetical protein
MSEKKTFYHMTREKNVESILKHGLRGGHNQNGTAIEYSETPAVYFTNTPTWCPQRYGRSCIIIKITKEKLEELGAQRLTGRTWKIKGEVGNEVKTLIPPEYLSEAWTDYNNGNCVPTGWCKFDCPEYRECPLLNTCKYCGNPNPKECFDSEIREIKKYYDLCDCPPVPEDAPPY